MKRRGGGRVLYIDVICERRPSLGDDHGNLVMTISQLKELKNATKSVISAQNNTIEDLTKWSAEENNNRSIPDAL